MERLFRPIDKGIEWAVILIFLSIVLVGTLQVFNRFFLNISLPWSEEYQRYGQIWVVFMAVPIAYRRGVHIGMEYFQGLLNKSALKIFETCVDLLWLALACVIVYSTTVLMGVLQTQRSPAIGVYMHYVYIGIWFGGFYMALVGVRRIISRTMGTDLESGSRT